jgi:benzoylformate decarboxylase
VALARSMGVPALRVEGEAALAAALEAGFAAPGPMLLDVVVDRAIPTLYRKGA